MCGGQQAWRATAEVDGLDGIDGAILMALRFRQDGFDELRVGELSGRVLVESAVGADVVAEGNVDVEMHVQEISCKGAEAQRVCGGERALFFKGERLPNRYFR